MTNKHKEFEDNVARGRRRPVSHHPKTDPSKYYIHDVETGYPVEVSREQHESWLKLWKSLEPELSERPFGHVYIIGTGGASGFDVKTMEDIFKNPVLHNLKQYVGGLDPYGHDPSDWIKASFSTAPKGSYPANEIELRLSDSEVNHMSMAKDLQKYYDEVIGVPIVDPESQEKNYGEEPKSMQSLVDAHKALLRQNPLTPSECIKTKKDE